MKSASEGKNTPSTGENGKNCSTGKSVRVRPQNPFKLIDCEKFSPVPCYSWYNLPPSTPNVQGTPTPNLTTATTITSTCVSQLLNNNSGVVNAPTTVGSVPSPGSSDSGCSSASSNLTSTSSNGQLATEAPFTVMISVEVLTIIDIHAHCVSNEVIGLLGGRYCPVFKQLHVLIAEPCKSISASTTDLQCEMDPVSQTEAAGKIFSSNNFVIGWYHSHPTFVPNPSLRDLETQGNYQEMFRQESNLPFIAIILSPYSGPCNPRHKHTLVSKFKCLMLSDQINPQGEYRIPYEFDPIVIRKDKLTSSVLNQTRILLSYLKGKRHTHCMVDRIRGRDISLVYKLTASIHHYLTSAGLSSREADVIVSAIEVSVSKHLSSHFSNQSHRSGGHD